MPAIPDTDLTLPSDLPAPTDDPSRELEVVDGPAETANAPAASDIHDGATGESPSSPDGAPDAATPGGAHDTDPGTDDAPAFARLGLPRELLDAVTRMGYETPTPIQAEAIPALLAGRDVVGIAQTGTGKTAAFGLPLLARIDAHEPDVQALVLAPTRELAMQSAQAMEDFAQRSRDVGIVPVYGGAPYGPQLGALRRGAQVVVGTPGRVIDLIERGALDLSRVRMLVLDEADEMLRMGFAEDVETIASSVPTDRLTALFSATMPAPIERVANTHLRDPLKIAVSEESTTVDTIHQTYAVVPYTHKIGALARVLATRDADAVLVFVRTRSDVEDVALEMSTRGFRASGISGDVAQKERERLVERLRDGTLDVLVATDVAARGLDVERIGLVVNFDVPREAEAYVHRIGRTGRAGREGRSLTFFTPREHSRLRRIERLTGTPMEEVQIPTPAEVSDFRARRVLDAVPQRMERGRLDLYHTLLDELRDTADLDAADIAAALLARAVGDEGPAQRASRDRRGTGRIRREVDVDDNGEFLSASSEGGRDQFYRDRPGSEDCGGARRRGGARPVGTGSGRRYRVEVGKKDGVRAGAIVGAITGEGGLAGTDLGRIDIYPTFSLVEISGELSEDAAARISKARVSGRALRIREDRGAGDHAGPGSRHEGESRDRGRDREGRGEWSDRRDGHTDRSGHHGGRSGRWDDRRDDRSEGRGRDSWSGRREGRGGHDSWSGGRRFGGSRGDRRSGRAR